MDVGEVVEVAATAWASTWRTWSERGPSGTGTGDAGYKFRDEEVKGEYTLGAVAMANAGPNTNGSQFFITIDDCTRKLSKDYSLFGYVVDGMDVATGIQVGDVMTSVTVEERERA